MKLRKMLGDINSETCKELMNIIKTQNKETLSKWSIEYTKENYYPIYKQHQSKECNIEQFINNCLSVANNQKNIKEIKEELKTSRNYPKEITNLIEEVSLRAIITSCATVQTPTNALGFLFYGCATRVYNAVGLENSKEIYDKLAEEELQCALESLKKVMIQDEKNPVKIKWNC